MCSNSRITSSFHGKIFEVAGISVDNFEEHNLQSRAFFLSHCHSDHTKGLFSSKLLRTLECNGIYIYMSELTAAIISDDCNGDPSLMNKIVKLDYGTTVVTLPSYFGYEEQHLRVTLIKAGHCLGSVMFLFETNESTVLYTGDFNLRFTDVKQLVSLHDLNKKPIKIDTLYVDTTFIDYGHEYFPKRSEVMNELMAVIKEWLHKDNKNRIALSLSAKYGYEYVFVEIYNKLGMKVYVNEERWAFYRQHPNLAAGVTNDEHKSRLHVCRGSTHRSCSIKQTFGLNFLTIRLSAMIWSEYETETSGVQKISDDKVNVCFATHCSRSQIIDFVTYFNPKRVIGFPNKYESDSSPFKEKADVDLNCIGTPRKRKIESPLFKKTSAVDKKVDKKVLKNLFDL
ncbi:hypothetical protein JYU34_001785 [Plutella xylostella]|uniref:Protein artemis n=1 Tax=Plutella xylostella TaxID=51655 RepID=A0ABQ7R4T5_PLUXY|nr:hypothetical protein JYU34_001785 [Plutella xylostella]